MKKARALRMFASSDARVLSLLLKLPLQKVCSSYLTFSFAAFFTPQYVPSYVFFITDLFAVQDAWPMLKERFSDEELAALTDLLVAPTYFS